MSEKICPYCDEPTWVEMADHDYAPEFDDECGRCGKIYHVSVEAIPHYTLTKPCEPK